MSENNNLEEERTDQINTQESESAENDTKTYTRESEREENNLIQGTMVVGEGSQSKSKKKKKNQRIGRKKGDI